MNPVTLKETVLRLVVPVAAFAMVATTVQGAVVYAGNSSLVYQFSAPTLGSIGTLVDGYGGSKDLAADTTGIYMTDAGQVWKFNSSGTLVASTFVSTFKTVASNANGYVYVANNGEIGRFTSGLTDWASLTSASNITDLAVSDNWIYATNGTVVSRYTLTGTSVNESFNTSTFSSVAVGSDGYVYVTNGGEVGRFNADLTGYTTLVSPAGGITDLAVANDGIYAVSGGTVYRFNLAGGWAGYNSSFTGGGFDTVATVVPEPAAAALLLLSGLGLLARRRSSSPAASQS